MGSVTDEKEPTVSHWFGDEASHGRDATLEDLALGERPITVDRKARVHLGPDLVIAPRVDGFIWRHLDIEAGDLG